MIVVMTQREKIGMEALFRRTIPPHKRDGSQFVFRQVLAPSSALRQSPRRLLLHYIPISSAPLTLALASVHRQQVNFTFLPGICGMCAAAAFWDGAQC